MARSQRIHIPDAHYHVMLRGNNGQPIFFDDRDRCRLCLFIQEGVERFGHRIHAFCFMRNHIHLSVQTPEIELSRIVQNFAFRYAAYLNKKTRRRGHVFQGRFKSILVDDANYLEELVRYIHLNPVRAGIVKHPEAYHWSSHRTYMGADRVGWLTTSRVLREFGTNPDDQRQYYNQFILAGIGVDLGIDFEQGNGKGMLGGEGVLEGIVGNTVTTSPPKSKLSLEELISVVCQCYHISLEELARIRGNRESKIRGMLTLLAHEQLYLSYQFIGSFLGRDPSGLRKLTSRLRKELMTNPTLQDELEELRLQVQAHTLRTPKF